MRAYSPVPFSPPWILSASDDGTCRIWDWKTRSCVNVTQAHKREVMSAKFHSARDIFVTASLDKRVRVWQVTLVRNDRHSAPSGTGLTSELNKLNGDHHEAAVNSRSCEYNVKSIDGRKHSNRVTWAVFNHVGNRIISATDSGSIYIWIYANQCMLEGEDFRRSGRNACKILVLTDAMKYILSVSENKSILVWNTDIRRSYLTHELEAGVYYTLQKPPNLNYLAAGHSSGLSAFKLFKERPIVTLSGKTLYYVSNYIVYIGNMDNETKTASEWIKLNQTPELNTNDSNVQYDALTGEATPIRKDANFRNIEFFQFQYRYYGGKVIDDRSSAPDYPTFSSPLHVYSELHRTKILSYPVMFDYTPVFDKFTEAAKSMAEAAPLPTRKDPVIPSKVQYNSYCSYGKLLLVTCTIRTWPFYEIIMYGDQPLKTYKHGTICYIGDGKSACFASAFLVVAIDFDKNVVLHTVFGDRLKQLKFEATFHKVFSICLNLVLLWGRNDTVLLYDVERDHILCQDSVSVGELLDVIVDESGKFIAAVFRNLVVIYDMGLNVLASVETQAKVKTAVWYNDITVIYATRDRMYYLMLNGDSGTIRSLDKPIYVLRIKENVLYYMKRDHLCYKMEIESAELALKLAIYRGDMDTVEELIASGKVSGHAMVEYLIEKGCPGLARKMSSDPQERFWLALKMGDIEGAMGDAVIINDSETWKRLGNVALEQGNCAVAELAFQKESAWRNWQCYT
ncbi:coatomer complex subunit alpha [Babesia caballi]|uniref:Coatomer complex subunit alpha n=1 Tax=Babesia caballi TaxID=5871 RepID=A0AAV4LUC3_BABCB|nr:coatomer complex subunit alpha [Babesia caballi]